MRHNTQLAMLQSPLLSVVFIAIFGKYYIVYFLFLQWALFIVAKKLEIILLPVDHTERIVTVGFHVTTAIMFIANTVTEIC